MDQAKAIVNLKEGLIDLEGPVEFVREYLNRFAAKGLKTTLKGIEVTPAEEGVKIKAKALRRKKRSRTGHMSSVEAVRAEAEAGFFNEPRSRERPSGD